jgi:hypothetical protein
MKIFIELILYEIIPHKGVARTMIKEGIEDNSEIVNIEAPR